jgi:hypothetical protein
MVAYRVAKAAPAPDLLFIIMTESDVKTFPRSGSTRVQKRVPQNRRMSRA